MGLNEFDQTIGLASNPELIRPFGTPQPQMLIKNPLKQNEKILFEKTQAFKAQADEFAGDTAICAPRFFSC